MIYTDSSVQYIHKIQYVKSVHVSINIHLHKLFLSQFNIVLYGMSFKHEGAQNS